MPTTKRSAEGDVPEATPDEEVSTPTGSMSPEELAALQEQNRLKAEELKVKQGEQYLQKKMMGVRAVNPPPTTEDLKNEYADFITETNKNGEEEVLLSVSTSTSLGQQEVVSIGRLNFPFVIGVKNSLQPSDFVYKLGFRKYPQDVVATAKSLTGHGGATPPPENIATRNDFNDPSIRAELQQAQVEGNYYETPARQPS